MLDSNVHKARRVSRLSLLLVLFFFTACSNISTVEMDEAYGEPDFSRYEVPVTGTKASNIDYLNDVKPVLEQRCIVCHGCYDSPCQLNLGSFEGLARGASKVKVYNAARLLAASPSRLFKDADSVSEWREEGFFPVLNERSSDFNGDTKASVMHRILSLKQTADSVASNQVLPNSAYDFSLNRDQTCPLIEEMNSFEIDHPQWGMPYGLPKLADEEYAILTEWIEAGAPFSPTSSLDDENMQYVDEWESFLNQDSLKAQLMSRYIYEHWFLAHLYFDAANTGVFFEIVRSTTAPGEAIQLVSTRRPYDDPGVSRVYYRLKQVQESIVSKTHMPYVLNSKKMENIQAWFLNLDYSVASLPSYDEKAASNPFLTFQDIPWDSRYRFLLEEARFTIMGFIKGPVCRGQVALNVINDHFWVVFADPDISTSEESVAEMNESLTDIRFPAENGSTSGVLSWRNYASSQMNYLKAKSAYINSTYDADNTPTLDLIWDGDGVNKNAALSIFRHFDTASVEYGLIGEKPQAMWVIGYPLLEKIHYLLVAGFDLYGNYGHQLTTRLYMDFLRMQGEFNLLNFLPASTRNHLVDRWYRGADGDTKKYFESAALSYEVETGIEYTTDDPYLELQQKLKQRLNPILEDGFDIESLALAGSTMSALESLAAINGLALEEMPPLAMMALEGNDGEVYRLTLIHNNGTQNVAHLRSEERRRLPEEDSLTVVRGFIGAYPNTYFRVAENDLNKFVEIIASLSSPEDYNRLLNQFGIRRTHTDFWQHSDETLQAFKEWNPIEYGLLDYNCFENR